MKRIVLLTVMMALAAPLMAQEEPGPAPPERDPRTPIIRYLDLSPSQVQAWDDLLQERHDQAAPLRQRAQEIQAELKQLMEAEEPEPTAVGELIIARRDVARQLAEVHRGYAEEFRTTILNEEQARRLHFIRRAEKVQRLIPVFRRFGLLAPAPRSGGDESITAPAQQESAGSAPGLRAPR